MCKHKNIVDIIAAYYHDNYLAIILEYCAGGAVDDAMLKLGKPLTSDIIAPILHQVVHGLAFLHSKNVIHRDIKASNILLTYNGIAKLGKGNINILIVIKIFFS